jgi:hypothetical protein
MFSCDVTLCSALVGGHNAFVCSLLLPQSCVLPCMYANSFVYVFNYISYKSMTDNINDTVIRH